MSRRNTTAARSSSGSTPSSTLFVSDYLPLAAYLTARGHPVELYLSGPHTILFSFPASDQLASDVTAFHTGQAKVSPGEYDAARIELRRRMDGLKSGAQ